MNNAKVSKTPKKKCFLILSVYYTCIGVMCYDKTKAQGVTKV